MDEWVIEHYCPDAWHPLYFRKEAVRQEKGVFVDNFAVETIIQQVDIFELHIPQNCGYPPNFHVFAQFVRNNPSQPLQNLQDWTDFWVEYDDLGYPHSTGLICKRKYPSTRMMHLEAVQLLKSFHDLCPQSDWTTFRIRHAESGNAIPAVLLIN